MSSAVLQINVIAAFLRGGDRDGHLHAQKCFGHPKEAAGHRRALADIASHCNGDQIAAADTAVGRIERDPAGTRQKNLSPSVSRARFCRTHKITIRIMQISRSDTRTEAEL